MGLILVVVIALLLIGGLPRWSHSREWGYAPSGAIAILLAVLVLLILLGYVRWWF